MTLHHADKFIAYIDVNSRILPLGWWCRQHQPGPTSGRAARRRSQRVTESYEARRSNGKQVDLPQLPRLG
jgi:hypothetical protein